MQSVLIQELIDALKVLPGVGPKSAQRMAYYLLERNRSGGEKLATTLLDAMEKVGHCQRCRTLSEDALCSICAAPKRQTGELCIVESPADIPVIEQSGIFKGQYFVLMGHLSPIDGIGPQEIGLDVLKNRLALNEVVELIIAINPSVEGEATIHYIQQIAQTMQIKTTRLAQGIPLGGELEYLDAGTLTQAFLSRKEV